MKKILSVLIIIILAVSLAACGNSDENASNGKPNIVATTTIVADLVKELGGDNVNVENLMGPGVDPHLYKASAGDVERMQKADMVVYNGLHLEGKMGEIFEQIEGSDKLIVAATKDIDADKLLDFITYPGNFDPHVWFDVSLWKQAAETVTEGLKELDSDNDEKYDENLKSYLNELDELEKYIKDRVEELPEKQRVLITAHDAFSYFGKAYGFDVKGLQGISTDSEAGTSDVRNLANFIVDKEIKAIFIESSVPKKNIEALQEAVESKGFEVEIGGELYSDSTGDIDSDAGTYIGAFRENIDTIVDALK